MNQQRLLQCLAAKLRCERDPGTVTPTYHFHDPAQPTKPRRDSIDALGDEWRYLLQYIEGEWRACEWRFVPASSHRPSAMTTRLMGEYQWMPCTKGLTALLVALTLGA